MSQRLIELSVVAEHDADVRLQLESEQYLSFEAGASRRSSQLTAWADEVADSYLIKTAIPVDQEMIAKLAEEVDF